MAQIHVDTLKKLRTKVLEQRRATALRQSAASQSESLDLMVRIQEAIEAIDRALADEERELENSEPETSETR